MYIHRVHKSHQYIIIVVEVGDRIMYIINMYVLGSI